MNDNSSKTILVADDDAAIRTVVTQALTRAGFDVRATGTASSLWHWISNGDGDLIITDVVLPDEEAFQVLPRIKKIRPRLPVVVMSAKQHHHDGDHRRRARRLRLSAEAVRPQRADLDCVARFA